MGHEDDLMPLSGECLCGLIKFEVGRFAGPFELCHCSKCRRAFGSAFAALIGVNRTEFRWISGEDVIEKFEAPVEKFPPGYRTAFCRTCGSPAPNIPEGADWFEIPAGLFETNFQETPDRHIYTDYASRWHEISDDLPQLTENALIKLRLKASGR